MNARQKRIFPEEGLSAEKVAPIENQTENMFTTCSNCLQEVRQSDNFCPYCGAVFTNKGIQVQPL